MLLTIRLFLRSLNCEKEEMQLWYLTVGFMGKIPYKVNIKTCMGMAGIVHEKVMYR